jgi:hypothetical protein
MHVACMLYYVFAGQGCFTGGNFLTTAVSLSHSLAIKVTRALVMAAEVLNDLN